VPHGEGTEYYHGAIVAKGRYKNNLIAEGMVFDTMTATRVTGRFNNRIIEYGTEENEVMRYKYVGAFSEGLYHGQGICYEDGVILYEGDWKKGRTDGQGTLYDIDGKVIS